MMNFNTIRPIQPLWDPLAETKEVAASDPAGSLFAKVFQKAIQDVRDTNAEQVNLEYQLSTGQLDNPAALNAAIYKATTAAELLMQMRNKALDAYNELMRISL